MRKGKKNLRIFTLCILICLTALLVSCLPGKLELTSFTVDRSSIAKTSYTVGEQLDLTGLRAAAKYSDSRYDKEYTLEELTLEYDPDITATAGTKEIKVSFIDPNLKDTKQTATVLITVTAKDSTTDEDEPKVIIGYEKPAAITAFEADKETAGELAYGESGFQGQFLVGDILYTVGDDNLFYLIPELTVYKDFKNLDLTIETPSRFYTTAQIYVYSEGEYIALEGEADGLLPNVTNYYEGEALIVSVDHYENAYDFSEEAVGRQIKLAVLPDEAYYSWEDNTPIAVTLELSVIDAYNVYSVKELSLVDNVDSFSELSEDDKNHIRASQNGAYVTWEDFKRENGLQGITPSGIVLHSDLKLTADDVPSGFFYELETPVTYYDNVNNKTYEVPAGTRYLREHSELYMNYNSSFRIEGNFFNLDTSLFPYVASPAVMSGDGKNYGSDFSNSTLFRFECTSDEELAEAGDGAVTPDDTSSIRNLHLIGNAGINNWVDEEGNLVSGGGLIFVRTLDNAKLLCENNITNSFFITYFADEDSELKLDSVKVYDSYQNAMMLWGNTVASVQDSFFNGAGGPLIIAQSYDPDATSTDNPTLTLTNTVAETHLSGEELWFGAFNATGVVSSIKALGMAMESIGLGNFADKDGKMNIISLLMPSGTNAEEIVQNGYTQGEMILDGNGICRWLTNPDWLAILQSAEFASGLPILSVTDADGNDITICLNPQASTVTNMKTGESIGVTELAAFASAEYVTLTQGGISVIFQLYHNA